MSLQRAVCTSHASDARPLAAEAGVWISAQVVSSGTEQPGCRTGTAGLVVAQVVVLETAVELRMCAPNCLSNLPELRLNYQAEDLAVVVASFRSRVAVAPPALPSVVEEEEVGASSVEGAPEVIV